MVPRGLFGLMQRTSASYTTFQRMSVTPYTPLQAISSHASVQAAGKHGQGDQHEGGRGERQSRIAVNMITGAAAMTAIAAHLHQNRVHAESDDLKIMPAAPGSLMTEKPLKMVEKYKSMYASKMKTSGDNSTVSYENRIRQFSTPDNTFNYFATYLVSQKNSSGTSQWVMMSPMDLFNALTPEGAQAQAVTGSGNYISISIDQLEGKTLPENLKKSPVSGSVLNEIGENGLISYNDFCFLLTVLSTPRRFISTAFELFDINGDGFLDAKEFSFTNSKLSYNPGGFGDYDITSKQNYERESHEDKGSGLLDVLFGKDRAKKMTFAEFSEFISRLQDEMIELEFREYDKNSTGRISEVDLGNFLLKHAKIPAKQERKMMKRVKMTWPAEMENRGVSLPSFKNLYQALAGGEDLQRAMYFLDGGDGVDLEDFQKIFKWVSKQELSDHVAEVMFVLFDNDMDGKICTEDIQNVLFNWRKARGFEKLTVTATVGHKKKDL